MNSITAIDPTSNGSPADTGADATAQAAFQQGIVKFMATLLQGAESDIISSINDSSSDPDDAAS